MFCSSDEKKPEVFATPTKFPITTSYRELADAMLDDLDNYGPDIGEIQSIAKWHYDLVNDYIDLDKKEFIDIVKKECFSKPDWTESIDNVSTYIVTYHSKQAETYDFKKAETVLMNIKSIGSSSDEVYTFKYKVKNSKEWLIIDKAEFEEIK